MEPVIRNKESNISRLKLARVIKIAAAALILILVLIVKLPASARFYGYAVIRELVKLHTVIGTLNMEKATSSHFYVKFNPGDRADAEMVLDTAERFYYPVINDFGFTPRGRIPLIIYSSREELNRSFGWQSNESAMGVYWAGTIRVLSPRAWVDEQEPALIKEAFVFSGPMAHELAHLAVDYLTGGNYPRWFTEGVAQYEEYKLTGFEMAYDGDPVNQFLYSMDSLAADFDKLPDQSLAYRESFAAVRYLVYRYGEKSLFELIKVLGRGEDFNQALKMVIGTDRHNFEYQWQKWYLSGTGEKS